MKRFLLCLLLTGCAMPPESARLYPENDVAAKIGVLEGRLTPDYIRGGGSFDFTMPDGETMKGEYAVVRQGVTGFGTVFGSVYSPQARAGAVGSAVSTQTTMSNANQGVVSAFGDRGTRAKCEFLHDGGSQRGYGACQLSNGALYRLQY